MPDHPSQRPSSLPRRTILRTAALGGALAMTGLSSACSRSSDEPRPTSPTTQPSTRAGTTATNVLLVYFSRPGENYYYGDRIDLEVGNTEVLAREIAGRIRCDVHKIEPSDPYPDDYEATVARNVREQDDDARPAIANPLDRIDNYDVVLLGSPIWNVRPPMIMSTFTETYDFAGKTVHPFTTHAMSGLGRAEDIYSAACPGAAIGEGLAVQGEEVKEAGPRAAADWLSRIGLT